MTARPENPMSQTLGRIEEERGRDASLRRVAKAAWIATFIVVIILIVLTTVQIANMLPLLRFQAGGGPIVTAVIGLALPLVFVLGALAVLIATLSTIGMFLRSRAATLQEIQLRLATLEELLTTRDTHA